MFCRKYLWLLMLMVALTGCDGPSSGDRVIVTKCEYEIGIRQPQRTDVVVFKYPRGPVERNVPKNYIKRLWGLPGEIIAIYFGRLFHREPGKNDAPFYDDLKNGIASTDLWQHTHENDKKSVDEFMKGDAGGFKIIRKTPTTALALRRIVYDNDHQAKDLIGKLPPRWNPFPGSGWKTDGATAFANKGSNEDQVDWLRYQHILRPQDNLLGGNLETPKQLITDEMGYNSGHSGFAGSREVKHWAGDLMLECNLDVTEPKGEFTMEVNRGVHRFQARFDLATGVCSLFKLTGTDPISSKSEPLGKPTATRVKAPGSYLVRFANFDARLIVWVGSDLPFENGVDYPPPEIRGPGEDEKVLSEDDLKKRRGPTENDLQPASLGSKGARIKLDHVKLWRDTYYIAGSPTSNDWIGMKTESWSDPQQFHILRDLHLRTMYVQPGHYLVLGDNSPASADSREWGLVPERLMLGHAIGIFYPLDRFGLIH